MMAKPKTQRTSDKGMMDIVAHEAIVLSRYKDVKGIWTIGVGHTKAAGGLDPETFAGMLSLQQAIELFRADLAKFERRVRRAFKRPLKQQEFDAAVSFDFNTGAIDRATWVETFNAGDRDLAIEQIMNWQKPPQIIPRRKKEQRLFASGHYGSDGTAMVYRATKAGTVLWKSGKRLSLKDVLGVSGGIVNEVPEKELPAIEMATPKPSQADVTVRDETQADTPERTSKSPALAPRKTKTKQPKPTLVGMISSMLKRLRG
jgi:lysozyme